MGAETADALAVEPEGSPADQAPAPTPEPAPAAKPTPTVNPSFNREFTQRSQALASIRAAVGLDESATPAEIAAAVEQLKAAGAAPAESDDPDDETLNDPRFLDLQRRAEQAEWTIAEGEYGEVAGVTREFAAFLRTERNPGKLTAKMYDLITRFSVTEETPPAAAPATTGEPPAPPAEAGLGANDDESLTARQLDQSVVDEFKGTGNVAGFLSKIGLVGREQP